MAENNYQKALRERVFQQFGADIRDAVYQLVKEEALKSWKNGINEGLKRAHAKPAKAAPVYTNGTALENGKLKPVEGAPATQL
jgi:hypothetical protein